MIWALVVPFALWALLRLTGADPHWLWTPLVAYTPYVLVVALVPLVVAAFLRRRAATAVAAASVLALGVAVLPRAFPGGGPAAGGEELRVLAVNLAFGQADAGEVVALVRRMRPHVLTLQELTPGALGRLDRAGLRTLLPHTVDRSAPRAGGSGLYAAGPLRELPVIEFGFRQARAVFTTPGGREVEVVSVHPCAPNPSAPVPCWAQGLDALPRAGGMPRVLAGDFNATLDHGRLRALLDSGYRDAADATGKGFEPTWPTRGDWEFLPRVAIDHVLASPELAVTGFSAHDVGGSDHRPVFASLRFR
ncbi:endonuclease/exonuclease/phosphatase family protein [Nonomuraea longicatena]